MNSGIKKWFYNNEGYGFISGYDGEKIYIKNTKDKEKVPKKEVPAENTSFDSSVDSKIQ